MESHTTDIMALIARAPWREAVTYRDTWPHEYVVVKKDGQEDLLAAFCERIARGEGVDCQFFGQKREYLFLGDHKYWTMTDCPDIDLDADDYVLNRALLYRDRRDFLIQPGDTGVREGEPTMAPEEGIEQLEVRNMWQTEDYHFTPWLAENLQLLGDVLGMRLEPVQQEAPVGPFSLDILAREVDEGVMVAIENQLEETDHDHLGKLLTYTTGCGAHVAVWVAREFTYEHAQALHRLNGCTGERIRFYGVKVEVVKRAGGSGPEPRFRKVVYPGGWNKDITLRSKEMPPRIRRYYNFFQPLIDDLLKEDFADKALQYYGPTGRFFPSRLHQDIGYAASLERKNDACVTFHIPPDDNEGTNRVFDGLKAERDQIEGSICAGPDPDWRWDRNAGSTASYIYIRRDGSIDDPPEKLEETRAWMLDLLPKFKKVVDPRLEKLLTQASP